MGGGGGGGRPASIEGKSPMLSSTSLNGLAVPDSPGSSCRGVTGPPAGKCIALSVGLGRKVCEEGVIGSACTHKQTQKMCLCVVACV